MGEYGIKGGNNSLGDDFKIGDIDKEDKIDSIKVIVSMKNRDKEGKDRSEATNQRSK